MKFNDKERMKNFLVVLGPYCLFWGKMNFLEKLAPPVVAVIFFLILQLSAIIQKTKREGRQTDRQYSFNIILCLRGDTLV